MIIISTHGAEAGKNAPNTCIVSASSPNHYGFVGPGAFISLFLRDLKPGLSLKDAFLKARRESRDSSVDKTN